MKPTSGPRPREVHLFALIFVAIGVWNLVQGLTDLPVTQAMMESWTGAQWSADQAIIAVSARFTIVLIPVLAIWGFASKIARGLVTIMALAGLVQLIPQAQALMTGALVDRFVIASTLGGLLAVFYLYSAPARTWFREYPHGTAKTFA